MRVLICSPAFLRMRLHDSSLNKNKAAGEVLTAKQAPHRPGTAPALGLRAGNDVSSLYRRPMEVPMFRLISLRRIALALAAFAVLGLAGPGAAGEDVPFKGRLEGDVTITPLAPPC